MTARDDAMLRDAIAPYPALERALDTCVRLLASEEVSVAAQGSLATGDIDAFSDVDLVLARDRPWDEADEAALDEVAAAVGEPLARFTARHLPGLFVRVYDLVVDGTVVKVDLQLVTAPFSLDKPTTVLHDRAGRFVVAPATADPPVDADVDTEEMCGWLWYAWTRACRGELMTAAAGVGQARQRLLLPMLQHQHGQPREDYRRLERRLPPEIVARLVRTWAVPEDAATVRRAIEELADLYDACLAALPTAAAARGRLARLRAHLDTVRPGGTTLDSPNVPN